MNQPLTQPRLLIACIGNIFLGDDGFGVEVARRLAQRPLPAEVTLKDFGIRGLDLTYALLDPYEVVILVDACPRGGAPGTLYLLEPDPLDLDAPNGVNTGVNIGIEAHSVNPLSVLRIVRSMGGASGRIFILGCEPGDLGLDAEDGGKLGLSHPVLAAVDEALSMLDTLISTSLNKLSTEPARHLHLEYQ
jgi:hydrogenase maturation protease